MARINFLTDTNGNVVTNGSTVFYPVTTTNAVYDSQNRTLKDILYGNYDPSESVIENNGIYKLIDNISKRFSNYVTYNLYDNIISENDTFKSNIFDLNSHIITIKSSLQNITTNFGKELSRIDSKIYVPSFDKIPTKGSSNLLTSGSIFSYFSKIISDNCFNFTQVTDINSYEGYNGELVLYLGPTTEDYVFGCLYRCNVSYTRNPDSVCHEKIKKVSWEMLGNIVSSSNVDMSNYYLKAEIDTMFRNLDFKQNFYYPGENIYIDENNIISAIVPKIDMSKYYTKIEIDDKLSKIKIESSVYSPGENILIQGNVISALVPDVSSFVSKEYVDDAISNIKTTKYSAGKNIVVVNDEISAVVDDELSKDSNNPISNSAVFNELSKKIDSGSLSQVAISGNYNDLNNKPSNNSYSFSTNSNNVSISTTEEEGTTNVIIDVSSNEQEVIVNDENKTLEYGQKTKIAEINGTGINVTMPQAPLSIKDVKVNGVSVVNDNIAEINFQNSSDSLLDFSTLTGKNNEKIDIVGPGSKIKRFNYNWFFNTKRLDISSELSKLEISSVHEDVSNGNMSFMLPSICFFVVLNKNETTDTELLFRDRETSDNPLCFSNSIIIKHNTLATIMLTTYFINAKSFKYRLKIIDECEL